MMDRLTFEGNFCDIAQCRELPCPYDRNCMQKQVWDRLKSYEDTSLSPEGLKQACEIEEHLNECGSSIARVAELIKADNERRVVVLPCKVGDELWMYGTFPSGWEVYKVVVSDVSTLNGRTVLNTYGFGTIRPEDIGKTVFLTREEAEKALEVRSGNQ